MFMQMIKVSHLASYIPIIHIFSDPLKAVDDNPNNEDKDPSIYNNYAS